MSAASGAMAVLAPLRALGRAYNAQAQRRPMATGLVTTIVKTSAADLFAQTVMEGTEFKDVDWRRHAVFCSFGFFYLGGFQYYLYNHLFVKWCHGITQRVGHLGSAPIKTFIDQAIHHPFCYFPVLYLTKGAFEGRPVASTWEKYKADLWDNCKALWTIWVPAQLVNFAFMPRHLRIPYVAGVSFLWTVVISMMRGALDKAPAPTSQQIDDAVSAVAAAAAAAAAPVAAAEAAAAPASAAPGAGAPAAGALEARQHSAGDGSGGDGSGGGGGGLVSSKGSVRGPAGAGLGLKALVGAPEVQT